MRTSWTNVDLTRVPELHALVAEARSLPTGREVMDELARRPTNLRIHRNDAWDADPTTADRAGTYDPSTTTMHLPERALHADDSVADRRDDLLTFVHESVHRNQLPVRFARAMHAVNGVVLDPWRHAGHAVAGAATAMLHGRSPLHGARAAADRSVLQVEVEAFDVEQRLVLDLARRDGGALPQLASPDEIALAIRPDYGPQIRRATAAAAVGLGAQGAGVALGIRELRRDEG